MATDRELSFNPNRFALKALLVLLAGWLLVMSALLLVGARFDPPPGRMLALFGPALDQDRAFRLVLGESGYLIGDGVAGRLWTVYSEDESFAGRLRARGALALWRREAFDWMFSTGCTGDNVALTRARPVTDQ